jgi:hypothetical protein
VPPWPLPPAASAAASGGGSAPPWPDWPPAPPAFPPAAVDVAVVCPPCPPLPPVPLASPPVAMLAVVVAPPAAPPEPTAIVVLAPPLAPALAVTEPPALPPAPTPDGPADEQETQKTVRAATVSESGEGLSFMATWSSSSFGGPIGTEESQYRARFARSPARPPGNLRRRVYSMAGVTASPLA